MKKIVFGVAAVALCGVVWVAVSGGVRDGTASGAVFDYDAATLEARDAWLRKQAEPTARRLHRSLPKGDAAQPAMRVAGWAVDARRRRIDLIVAVGGDFQLDTASLEGARAGMVASVCPVYAKSELGANGVTLRHRFVAQDGREALAVAISPVVCRAVL